MSENNEFPKYLFSDDPKSPEFITADKIPDADEYWDRPSRTHPHDWDFMHATAEGGLYQGGVNDFAVVEPSPDGSYKVVKHLSSDESYAMNMALLEDAPWPDAFAPVKSAEQQQRTPSNEEIGGKFEATCNAIENKPVTKVPKKSPGMSLFDKLASGDEVVDIDHIDADGEAPDPAGNPASPRVDEPPITFAGSILPPEEEDPQSEPVGTISPPDPAASVPDFLKTIYRRENWPAEGYTSWYLKPTAAKPAFVEHPGEGLHFEDSRNPDALRAGLMLARERGWIPAKLSGTPEFCSRAFLVAAELGLRTTGYVPTDADLKALEARGLAIPTAAAQASMPPAAPVVLATVAENEHVATVTKLLRTMDWQYFSGSPEVRQAGHDHLDRILSELEAVAATNPTEAAAIWDKYAPADLYRPTYLPTAQHADSGFGKLIQAVKDALSGRPTSAPQKSSMAPK